MQTFDWYVDRLELASWESQEPGSRSGFFACPVHGGSDSLHVTEKNGKALLKCFACTANALEITAALDVETTKPIVARPTRKKLNGVSPAAKQTGSPLTWMAERCAVSRQQLDGMHLPLSETEDAVVFEFANARKLRIVGEGKKGKDFRWEGADIPPLWPTPESPASEVVVCEGEADAICLRYSDIEAYSVTKGAGSSIPAVVWDALRAAGVDTVRLVFDLDDAGRKGRDQAATGARLAGLKVRESRVVGIDALAGETDARSVALRRGYPLVLEDDADEDEATMLADVSAVPPAPSILGRLHPSEHSILFGDGGVGKGVVAAWWIGTMTRELGMRVLILDYEQHAQYEWRPRVEVFGGNLNAVFIVQPVRPIWDIASWVAGQAELHHADYLVVDSVTYACVGQEVEKSVTATRYSLAIATIGLPALSLAHVPKATDDPSHPFGSTFWSNGARVTIAMSREQQDDPYSTRILRNAKTNQHAPFLARAIEWDWLNNERPGKPVPGKGYNTLVERDAYTSASSAIKATQATLGKTNVTPEEVYATTGKRNVKEGNIRQVNRRERIIVARRAERDPDVTRDDADAEPGADSGARPKRAVSTEEEDAK
jgi:hypothetical protein